MAANGNKQKNPPPGLQKPKVANDDYAYIEKKDVTVQLNTNSSSTILNDTFTFSTTVCLIYAEKIKIEKSFKKQSGKSIGLFCSEIEIEKGATVDVSGDKGDSGTTNASENGGAGGHGKDAGNVWMFVQEATPTMLEHLNVRALGGDGGRGGSTSAESATPGAGGKGGNGGNVEFLFGSSSQSTARALNSLRRQPWPEQALDLIDETTSLLDVPKSLKSGQKQTVLRYQQLKESIQSLVNSLEPFTGSYPSANSAREKLLQGMKSSQPPQAIDDGFASVINALGRSKMALNALDPCNASPSTINSEVQKFDRLVPSPQKIDDSSDEDEDSGLSGIVNAVQQKYAKMVRDMEKDVHYKCRHIEGGPGGQGGEGASALAATGTFGKSGSNGNRRAVNLSLDGSKKDLDAAQVFAFPEQCRMLLNKANRLFFTNGTGKGDVDYPGQSGSALELYQKIISRLSFLKNIKWDEADPSKLASAYTNLESKWEVTMFSKAQFGSILQEAQSRRNRLLLGQDMWGHLENWAPRPSVQFHDKELDRKLALLKDEESATQDYETAREQSNAVESYVSQGIQSMSKNKNELEATIAQLTDKNGPLEVAIYRIAAYTPKMKTKRKMLNTKIKGIQFDKPKFDPDAVLDAISSLGSIEKKNPIKAVTGLPQLGYKLYKQYGADAPIINMEGKEVNRAYVIDQLTTCGDTLESLQASFSTRKDNTIEVDDPKSIKIITEVGNVKKILQEFKNAIPQYNKKDLEGELDAYVELVKTRNNAVVQYNSDIQQLAEAYVERDYYEQQIQKLGQKGFKIDNTLPYIVFWLRKCRDSLQLNIMQLLNEQSRAIRFWGLQEKVTFSNPMPLQNHIFLSDRRNDLRTEFARTIEKNYAAGVRNTWPLPGKQGLWRRLSQDELNMLKQSRALPDSRGREHTLDIRISPQADRETFESRIDIRLSQIRLWLPGVKMRAKEGRKLLLIRLIHLGDEVIRDRGSNGPKDFYFNHDPVTINFGYDSTNVATREQATSDVVFGQQSIQNDHYIGGTIDKPRLALLGPFTTWRISIETDQYVNPELDLSGVTEAFLEFHGTHRPS